MKATLFLLLLLIPAPFFAAPGDEFYRKGLEFYQDRKILLAVGSFRKAMDEGRKDALVCLYLGNCYVQQGENDRALDLYTQGLLAGGETDLQATIYHNIGYVYYAKKDWTNSIDYFRKAAALDPTQAQVHWYSGMAFYQMRDKESTIREWETYLAAVKTGPQYENIRKALEILKATNYSFPPDRSSTNAIAAQNGGKTNKNTVPDTLIDIEGLIDLTRPTDKGKVNDNTQEGIEK